MKTNLYTPNKTKAIFVIFLLITFSGLQTGYCWSNGGYSTDPSSPVYGTHDWIAEQALKFVSQTQKQFILDNYELYLYGTEMPDNPSLIGDTTKHHVYYDLTEALQDDSSATRAQEIFDLIQQYLNSNQTALASQYAGVLTHYISDMAVFGHVMGESTDWGAETHHSDYENYVNNNHNSFRRYIRTIPLPSITTAYNATLTLAYNTTFGNDLGQTCNWMDINYNWDNPLFTDRCGESLNLAVNIIAQTISLLNVPVTDPISTPTPTPTPTPTNTTEPTTEPTPTTEPVPTTEPTEPPTITATPTPTPIPVQTDNTIAYILIFLVVVFTLLLIAFFLVKNE